MSYLDGLPAYLYQMPCGHSFRSLSRSAPDDETGVHWFYCRECGEFESMTDTECRAAETPPLHPSGMRMSDNQLAVRINAAIIKDRIAACYRVFWNTLSLDGVAEMLGVKRDYVKAVALDLGVYE